MNKLKNIKILKLGSSLVRSVNPETYTLNCVYSEEEVNSNDNFLKEYTKHVVVCDNSNCSYYQRLVKSAARINGETRGAAMVGVTHCAV
jgi:hypothetical protein